MILTCPSCGTQYAVKDGAIAAGGRKVRCASCGESWHQEPEAAAGAEPAPSQPEVEEPIAEEEFGSQPEVDQAPGGDGFAEDMPAETPLAEPPGSVPVPPPDEIPLPTEDMDGSWDPEKELPDAEELEAVEDETAADRKRSWQMAIFLAIAIVVLIAAAFWFFAPDSLRQRVGFAAAQPTPLQIAPGTPERQTLASGNELVVVSGRVINPSGKVQQVPPIEAQLRDKGGRLVYSWTIAPPAPRLKPGESVPFNSAEMDVPASGLDSTVTLTLKG
jgi:predicted Zn finger-like uncharacterized protein